MKSSTTEEFVREFNILTGSGIGVIMIHTREPHRTQEVLHEIAYDKEKPFHVWDVVYGWRIFGDTPTEQVQTEPVFDSYKALRRIANLDGGAEVWNEGYFLMHYTHWTLPKHPGFIQCLKHYVRQFAETKQRLVLLVPEGFVPPEELQNDVTIVDFPLPSKKEVRDSLCNIIEAGLPAKFKGSVYSDAQIDALVSNAQGMTKLESENAFSEAIIANKDTWPNTSFEDFNSILLGCKTDVVKRSEVLELMEASSFNDVGGLDLFKEYISQRTRAFSKEARDFGVDVPKGIMLIGPPGTGKSLCAKASSSALGLPLIKFDVSSVYGSLVGQSEQRVKAALSQLDAMSPCIALIDEIDKGLGGAQHAGGDSGVSKRVLGAILTHMQESKAAVYWIFTANRADSLDPALIRKGRLDEIFCVTVPNIVERLEIIKIHLRKRKQNPDAIADLDKAVTRSKGYVASEIESAIAESVNQAFHRNIPVTGQLIVDQFRDMKPLSIAFKEDFDKMMKWAENNARLTSTGNEESVAMAAAMTPGNDGTPRRRKLDTK